MGFGRGIWPASMPRDGWDSTFELAQAAWPGIAVSTDAFRRYCEERSVLAFEDPERASDLYLACACTTGDGAALRAFEQHLLTPARASVRRVDADAHFVEEVMQELRHKLFVGDEPRINSYMGQGSLLSWVRVAATRLAIDLGRAGQRQPLGDPDIADRISSAEANPELSLLKETYRPSFQSALTEALAGLSVRERNLLRMSLLEGLSIDEIAVPFAVHRATAARWLTAIKDKIREAVRAHVVAENPGLRESDLSSLSRAVDSELHISLSTVLGR